MIANTYLQQIIEEVIEGNQVTKRELLLQKLNGEVVSRTEIKPHSLPGKFFRTDLAPSSKKNSIIVLLRNE